MLTAILAQASGAMAENVEAIRLMVEDMHVGWPGWVHKLLLLMPVVLVIAVVLVWQRQRTIARNQVQIAKMVEELLEGRKRR